MAAIDLLFDHREHSERVHQVALSGLLLAVADMGLNVLDVEHHRSGMSLPISTVEVLVVDRQGRPHGASPG